MEGKDALLAVQREKMMNACLSGPPGFMPGFEAGMSAEDFDALPLPGAGGLRRSDADEEFQKSLVPGVLELVRFLAAHTDLKEQLPAGLFLESPTGVVMVSMCEVPRRAPSGELYAMTCMGSVDKPSQPVTLEQFLASLPPGDPRHTPVAPGSPAQFVRGFRDGVNHGDLVPFVPFAGTTFNNASDLAMSATWKTNTLKRQWPIVYNAVAAEVGVPAIVPGPKTMGDMLRLQVSGAWPVVDEASNLPDLPVDSLLALINTHRKSKNLPRMRCAVDILTKGLSSYVATLGVLSPFPDVATGLRCDGGFDVVVALDSIDQGVQGLVVDVASLCDPDMRVATALQMGIALERWNCRSLFKSPAEPGGLQHVDSVTDGWVRIVVFDPTHGTHDTPSTAHPVLQGIPASTLGQLVVATTLQQLIRFFSKR